MIDGGYGAGMYTSNSWQYGNQQISLVTQAYADLGLADIWEQQDAFNKSAVAVEAAGFYFDPTNVDVEIAAVATVYGEYSDLLNRGSAEDFDAILAEFVQKLYANGLQAIIDEANVQYEALLAAK